MKKPEFPKVLKLGQTKATIYKTPSHGCTSFTVVWYEGAVRKRKSCGDIVAAEVHANGIVESMSKGETQILNLSGEERLSYTRSREAVAEFGLALDGWLSSIAMRSACCEAGRCWRRRRM